MAIERVFKTAVRVGLRLRDSFDAIFFGNTQTEIGEMESILRGRITSKQRIAYQHYRLNAVGLGTEQCLVSPDEIMVYGTRETQDQEERILEQKRLVGLTLEELDTEVRSDARHRLITALTFRGKKPEAISRILSEIDSPRA